MAIPTKLCESREFIIPFTYVDGNCIISNVLPSEDDLVHLPILDITSQEAWVPKRRPIIEFDHVLYQSMKNRSSKIKIGSIQAKVIQ